jgi:hypothetical protein
MTRTEGGWEVRQPFPGIIVWRDPYGAHHLVDATGTRQVTGSHPRGPGDQIRPPLMVTFTELLESHLAA